MKIILIALAIGLFAGIMAGLCGVGGGIVMVPTFVFLLGMEQKAAIATSMAVIVPTSLMAIWRFNEMGHVQWNVFWPTAVGAVAAAWLATGWVRHLSNEQLTKIFAVLMIAVGVSMLFKKG
ncbi:MAG: sulfite exporter TauE/SafE family protein [Verrucomicrobiales bacterium]